VISVILDSYSDCVRSANIYSTSSYQPKGGQCPSGGQRLYGEQCP
jgi:hypothetical protein